MSELKFVFIVFCFTAVAILAVLLRNTRDRIFYQIVKINAEQQKLERQLWQKQLRLESLINPAAVRKKLEQEKPSTP